MKYINEFALNVYLTGIICALVILTVFQQMAKIAGASDMVLQIAGKGERLRAYAIHLSELAK